jgi:cellulose synthase/poly-beta-1,6-N-acetylglucosamine synthase-like glycosyltransferase
MFSSSVAALLSYLTLAVFLLVVTYFSLYVLLELRALLISNRVERRKLTEAAPPSVSFEDGHRPPVSVLLPIYNESNVVERLLDAVCSMHYPAHALEILVLDDSSDGTSALAQAKVDQYTRQKINIRLIRRQDRRGYKAGNLINGIQQAFGEFYAIFDADFVPPPDFLLRTIPCFKDPCVGYLQTGIGYENRDVSFLTRFQAMEMGHQQYVTVGLSEEGNMVSLSGSSCVWRKKCVEELGGWNASTVTEDVDLGYRAQFEDWKYVYLRDVTSMSILPESVSAFRVQRERWGRGLIHSGFKHFRQMMRQRMPLMKKLHAVSMMFSSVLLASIYVVVLLSLPLNYIVDFEGVSVQIAALFFFVLAAVWGLYNVFGANKGTQSDKRSNVLQMLWDTYLYIALFLPMSWYYFAGGIRALLGIYGDFHRTPKGKDETRSTIPRINSVLLAGELFSFVYSFLAIVVALREKNFYLIPLNLTVCVGFGMVLFWSCRERKVHEPN